MKRSLFVWFCVWGMLWTTSSFAQTNRKPTLLLEPLQLQQQPQPEGVQEGKLFQLLVEAWDPDGVDESLQFRLNQAPSSQQILLVPIGKRGCCVWRAMLIWWPKRAAGTFSYRFDIEVSDLAGLKDTKTFVFKVRNQPTPPAFSTQPTMTATQGAPYTYEPKASSPESPNTPISYRLLEAPEGMSIDDKGKLSWSPSPQQTGPRDVVLEARDTRGLATLQRFQIAVKDLPDVPQFISQPIQGATVGVPYIYQARASDADGDTLSFSLLAGPSTMKIDASQGLIRWIPQTPGKYNISLQVRDSSSAKSTNTQQWTIEVFASNQRPVLLTDAPQSIAQNDTMSYVLRALDPDGDDLAFSLEKGPVGMTLRKQGSNLALLSWTPGPQDVRTHEIAIRVDDKRGGVRMQRFLLYVQNRNDPPKIISQPHTHVMQGALFRYWVRAQDPDPQERLTFSLNQAPAGMEIEPSSGWITWQPTAQSTVQTHTIQVHVADRHGGFAVQTFQLEVHDQNDPPRFTSTPPQTASEDQLYTYNAKAEDPDSPGATLFFRLLQGPAQMTINGASGVLQWKPSQQDVGVHFILLEVVDADGLRAQQHFSLKVQNVNNPPLVLSSPSPGVLLGQTYRYQIIAKDPDPDDSVSFSLENGPSQMQIDSRGLVSWTPTAAEISSSSSFKISIRLLDPHGASTLHEYTLRVFQTNQTPTVQANPSTRASEGLLYSSTLQASDPDGDTLTFALEQGPVGMSIDDKGKILWMPKNSQVGVQSVSVRVDDSKGGIVLVNFTIQVQNRNQPPLLTSSPPLQAMQESLYIYAIRAFDPDPSDTLSYQLVTGPQAMIIDAFTGLLQWKPGPEDARKQEGIHEVIVKVVDNPGGESALQRFFIRVFPRNAPPSFTSTPPTKGTQSTPLLYSPKVSDDQPASLMFRLWQAPAGMTLGPYSGTLRWNPGANAVGNHPVDLLVIDPFGLTQHQTFSLQIQEHNEPPRFLSSLDGIGASVGKALRLAVPVQDPEQPPSQLQLSLLDAPTASQSANQPSLNSATQTLSWTPASEHQNKHHLLTIAAKDPLGAQTLQSFSVFVAPSNQPPQWVQRPTGPVSVAAEQTYQVTLEAKDPDQDTLQYVLRKGPPGMWLLPRAGILQWTPSPLQAGTHQIECDVHDGRGAVISTSFQLKVLANSNLPPRITSSPPASIPQGQTLQYTVQAVDDDGPSPLFRLETSPPGATFDPSSGLLSWTPSAAQVGTHSFVIRAVDDKGAVDRQRFLLRVLQHNDPPSFVTKPAATPILATQGSPLHFVVQASDPDPQTLTFQLRQGPPAMRLLPIDKHSTLVLWNPSNQDALQKQHSFTIQVSDEAGARVSQTFQVEVQNRNDPPRFLSAPCQRASAGGTAYECVLRAEDIDPREALSFRLLEAPANMTLKSENVAQKDGGVLGIATLNWSPKTREIGPHRISLAVTDSSQAQAVMRFVLTVSANEGNPIADPGEDQQSDPGEIQLDGSNSSDPKGETLSCLWSVEQSPANPPPPLQEPKQCQTRILLRKAGLYIFKLVAMSKERQSAPAFVRVNVRNVAPHAVAWAHKGAKIDQKLTLDGAQSDDANGDAVAYSWKQINTNTQLLVPLDDPSAATPSFTPKKVGIYRFQMNVSDLVNENKKYSQLRTLSIVVHDPQNKVFVPHAVILAPDQAFTAESIPLDGTRSRNLSDKEMEYQWSLLPSENGQIPTEEASLTHPLHPKATFRAEKPGVYQVGLIVKYGDLSSLMATKQIVVHGPDSKGSLPTAHALSVFADFGKQITLDGSQSIDPTGGQLTFFWRQLDGNDLIWKDQKTAKPSFFALRRSDSRIELRVQGKGAKSPPVEILVRTKEAGNEPPIARTDPDQKGENSRTAGQAVELRGHKSEDPEGATLSYRWRQTSGFPVPLYHARTSDSSATFVPPTYGIYGFTLEVFDGATWSMPALLQVVVHDDTNHVPHADAGPDQEVRPGQSVQLDGSKSRDLDADDTLTYLWRLRKPAGVQVSLNVADPRHPVFTVTSKEIPSYTFGLRVDDGKSSSLEDTVTIRVLGVNKTPIASIEKDIKQIFVGDLVRLDGSKSSDEDNDPLTFSWEQLDGEPLTLSSTSSKILSFRVEKEGVYRFQLRVSDGQARSAPDEIIFQVKPRSENKQGCQCQPLHSSPPPTPLTLFALWLLWGLRRLRRPQ